MANHQAIWNARRAHPLGTAEEARELMLTMTTTRRDIVSQQRHFQLTEKSSQTLTLPASGKRESVCRWSLIQDPYTTYVEISGPRLLPKLRFVMAAAPPMRKG